MRKVTETTVKAFIAAESCSIGNSTVKALPNVTVYELFGNEIAYRYNDPDKTLRLWHCEWETVTTSERLTGILQQLGWGYTSIKKGEMYMTLYKVGTFRFDMPINIVDGKNID